MIGPILFSTCIGKVVCGLVSAARHQVIVSMPSFDMNGKVQRVSSRHPPPERLLVLTCCMVLLDDIEGGVGVRAGGEGGRGGRAETGATSVYQ